MGVLTVISMYADRDQSADFYHINLGAIIPHMEQSKVSCAICCIGKSQTHTREVKGTT